MQSCINTFKQNNDHTRTMCEVRFRGSFKHDTDNVGFFYYFILSFFSSEIIFHALFVRGHFFVPFSLKNLFLFSFTSVCVLLF